MTEFAAYEVSGSYYEVCNCEAICPCRRVGDVVGGRSTYGICQFMISWRIDAGHAGPLDLAGLFVVMAGHWDDDEPETPVRVTLYVDERSSPDQQAALARIFTGRAGGNVLGNFLKFIKEVYAVRPARIELDHTRHRQRVRVESHISVRTREIFPHTVPVVISLVGHTRPGQEIVAEEFRVNDGPLQWEYSGRCGFVNDFAYASGA